MRDPGDRTKVVLRHLPPGLSRSVLKEQIDSRFCGGYNWFSFSPGRSSHRHQQYSRAYIDFRSSEDVIQFAQAFDGHVFVNEKGSHFKAIVEYAPSQRLPKTWSKKDGREGTIFKDIEYLEFLEMLAKPVDSLPSAEVQLERKEAERAAAGAKDNLIVTPLMNYIRQKRAAKSGSQRLVTSTGKLGRRGAGSSAAISSTVTRRGPGKRTTATYVMKDNTRIASNKDKSTIVLFSRREDQRHSDLDQPVQVVSKMELVEDDSMRTIVTTEGITTGGDGSGESGKRKLLLFKNKEKEVVNGHIAEASSSNAMGVGSSPQRCQLPTIKCVPSVRTGGSSSQRVATSPVRGSPITSNKQNQRRDVSGRTMRGVQLDKEIQQSPQLPSTLHAEQQNHASYTQRDEKVAANDYAVATMAVKQDRRMRNKDRPDRPVWTPRRRSDGIVGADESQLCIRSAPTMGSSDVSVARRSQACLEEQSAFQDENNEIIMTSRIVDTKAQGSGRHNIVGENGNHRQALRRPLASGVKELDFSSNITDTKSPKRGGILGHGSHEKQVWVAVQKSA